MQAFYSLLSEEQIEKVVISGLETGKVMPGHTGFAQIQQIVRSNLDAVWRPRFAAVGRAFVDWHLKRAGAVRESLTEVPASLDLSSLAADLRDPRLRDRATAWRETVEAALAVRLGGGAKAHEMAAILFAAWQGQALWERAGGRGFKLKDALKRLD